MKKIRIKKIISKAIALIALLAAEASQVCLAGALPITSEFGWRNDPYTGEWKFHAGVDLGYDYGTSVSAIFDGQIACADNLQDGYGNQVVIYSNSMDVYTRYAHLNDIYVIVGQTVSVGELIGSVGSTGRSTGPHLHLEYIVPDGAGGYIYENPIVLWQ